MRLKSFSKRPSPALVISVIALFVALGGSGYAAVAINGKNIKNRSIAGKKLKKGTVGGAEVKNGSLGAVDFKAGQLPGGPPGPRGQQGLPGARGQQGLPGTPGSARAYGEIGITATGDYELLPGRSKNVVGVTHGGGGNDSACIELDPSIDATTAVAVATPNARTGGQGSKFDTQLAVVRPLGYCQGIPGEAHTVEIHTSPGERAFFFAVM